MSDWGGPDVGAVFAEARCQAEDYEANKGDFWLTSDMAEVLGVHPKTVTLWCRSKIIPAQVAPDGWVCRRGDFRRWMWRPEVAAVLADLHSTERDSFLTDDAVVKLLQGTS